MICKGDCGHTCRTSDFNKNWIDVSTLRNLINSQTIFWLTGSYSFGLQQPDSDVDVFVEDSKAVRDELASYGIKVLPSLPSTYGNGRDPFLVAIAMNSDQSINVQLVNDIGLKFDTQMAMEKRSKGFLRSLQSMPKKNRFFVWQAVASDVILKSGKKSIQRLPDLTTKQVIADIAQKVSNGVLPEKIERSGKCPLCGSSGEWVFNFYCTNPDCSNYKP